jgi:trehalose synthase
MPLPLTSVDVGTMPLERFATVLLPEPLNELQQGIREAPEVLAGRRVWNVSSTASGGGVAEMLTTLLAYARGIGVDARWEVIGGGAGFFELTKRIHNRLHGFPGDGGPLGEAERDLYEASLVASGEALARIVRSGDIVIFHDPQTAGLVPVMRACGVPVVWRCHVGVDQPNALVRETWRFLEPYVAAADVAVFSRAEFVWDGLDPARVAIITPSLDAFAPKNQLLDEPTVAAILNVSGLCPDGSSAPAAFERMDGTPDLVRRRATLTEERTLRPGENCVLQISRWDALKDPRGVVAGFAEYIAPHCDAHLVCAGPDVDGVADDPEGARVLDDVREQWARLPRGLRTRIHLAVLPVADPQENGAIVNALQRSAAVVVQKSLAEGFGLTVAEAMWKGRPVAASRIGGSRTRSKTALAACCSISRAILPRSARPSAACWTTASRLLRWATPRASGYATSSLGHDRCSTTSNSSTACCSG